MSQMSPRIQTPSQVTGSLSSERSSMAAHDWIDIASGGWRRCFACGDMVNLYFDPADKFNSKCSYVPPVPPAPPPPPNPPNGDRCVVLGDE